MLRNILKRGPLRYLLAVFMLAVAYGVTGKLGLLLATPPGYATAIWPPSGLALAALLVWGYRVWPGIALGSFLINLWTVATSHTVALPTFVTLAVCIGLGAALQACVGAFLVRRVVTFPSALDQDKDIGWFLLLGGPVSCLTNASIGITSLWLSGTIPSTLVVFSWWTWWVGDTIGVLIVTPIVLVWTAEPRQIWQRRRRSVTLPLALAFTVAVVLFVFTSTWEQDRIRLAFERQASTLAHTLEDRFYGYLRVLNAIERFYTGSREVTRREFHTFVQGDLARHPGIQALEWIPRVGDAERAAYEQSAQQDGHLTFQITEQTRQGTMVPAAPRSVYFPVYYVAPYKDNERALGFDLGSNPTRLAAMQRARDTGKPVATARITLVQETDRQFGLLIFLPVYRNGMPHNTVEARRRNLLGFALGVFRVGDMIEALLRASAPQQFTLRIHDEETPADQRLLYRSDWHRQGEGAPQGTVAQAVSPRNLQWRTTVEIAGRRWSLQFVSTSALFAVQRNWQPWAILTSGLVFSGLLGACSLVLTGRTSTVERLVATRTEELSRTNTALAREIGERQHAEEAQRESEARFRSTFSRAGIGMALVDMHGRPIDSNPALQRMLGYTADELRTMIFTEFTHPEDADADLAAYQELIAGQRDHYQMEKRYYRQDGQLVWGHLTVSLVRDTHGHPAFAVGMVEDITARKQAEDALRQQRDLLDVTLASIGDAVMATDTNGTVTFLNRIAEELTGWSRQDAIGQPLDCVFHIMHEQTRETMESPVARVLREGVIVGLANHTTLLRRDGVELSIADSGAPIRGSDGILHGVVVVFRDITEQKQLEDALLRVRKIESVGVLAGGIAHDFNNLLTGILGNISVAKLFVEPNNQVEARLTEAENACQRAAALTHQLLTFSRGGAPVRDTVSLGELLTESVNFSLRGTNIRADFTITPDLWPAFVDADQITQVFHNMTLNAVQAMPDGGRLVLEADNSMLGDNEVPSLPAGRYVRIIVRDTGCGIPASVLPNIFDPYFTTKESGSGLGLATVYAIIRKHDGAITVDSTPDVGTTFTIYLPASLDPIRPQPAAPHTPLSGHGRVLVVDDDATIRTLLDTMLTSLGYEVACVSDGGEALTAYQQAHAAGRPFAAVILDITIPGGMGGKETIEHLRSIDPDVKALISSGYANDPVMANFRQFGFSGVVPKPYTVRRLHDALQRVMRG